MTQTPVLRVTDLKQYCYCPRVVYYQYVLPVDRAATYKMEKGKVAQEELEVLEARRKLKRYGLDHGRKVFGPSVYSEELGLSGKLDLLIETSSALYPVDFKFTRGRPYKNHVYQLGGYALILEETREVHVDRGFVYLIPQNDAEVFELSEKLKEECRQMLKDIREMIAGEHFPDAPSQRTKCNDCEYQNYCRDIW
jgi:CRISPR-associated exonuclease Cas4